MKKFRDYFDINELFNPSVFYTGEIILGNINSNLDIMTMNSDIRTKYASGFNLSLGISFYF